MGSGWSSSRAWKAQAESVVGGQRQRVALAASLARRPQVLLLCEPLAALTKSCARATQHELMELAASLGHDLPSSSHDQEEAMTMAGRIGVMDAAASNRSHPRRALRAPERSRWVAEFVGDINSVRTGEVKLAQSIIA